jgi:hypothetical protein
MIEVATARRGYSAMIEVATARRGHSAMIRGGHCSKRPQCHVE